MKSHQILKNEAKQKLKNNKKENALGVISKSLKANINLIINQVYHMVDHKSYQL